MKETMITEGDDVVHQGRAGRWRVVNVRPRPAMNIYSKIITIRSQDGVECEVLDTSVRKVVSRPVDACPE